MGEDLFGKVTDATGLPKELVSDELERLLCKAGIKPGEMTLEDLRSVLAEYVQDVLLEAKEKLAEPASEAESKAL